MSFEKRAEFVLFFDVKDGNPNGDPDAGNAPRVDPETGYGFVTDVCLKRKIRNYVSLTKGEQPPNDIYVKERGILAREQKKAYTAIGAVPTDSPNEAARRWMCENYFDVRTFGAVMTTGKAAIGENGAGQQGGQAKDGRKNQKLWNCGQVRGPVRPSRRGIENVFARGFFPGPSATAVGIASRNSPSSSIARIQATGLGS